VPVDAMAPRLRPITPSDHGALRAVYQNAVRTQAPGLYSDAQVAAWAAVAVLPGLLDRALAAGEGLLIEADDGVEAFALLHPPHRLALLYCRGDRSRRGHGGRLVRALEALALQRGQTHLVTEASLISRPLLERLGWRWVALERLTIGGVPFERHRLRRELSPEGRADGPTASPPG
jgi:putative acetyltransferase